jgi:acyl-CoA synthetase (AMP-forming)/AMP-acid ligase II
MNFPIIANIANTRLKAFAGAVKNAFPSYLRLSIHQSVGEHKVSMSLLNTKTGFTTPWHCSVALMADGEWISAPAGDFEKNPNMEVIYEDGRPSYYRETLSDTTQSPSVTVQTAGVQKALELVSRHANGLVSGSEIAVIKPIINGQATTPRLEYPSTPGSESGDKLANIPNSWGKRLIPHIADNLASTEPSRTVFSIASFPDGRPTFQNISARQFANAVDKTAWWLQAEIGASQTVRPVAYIGPHDLRHILLTYACVKVGYAALYLSPKNNTKGALAVLDKLSCDVFVKVRERPCLPLVEDILQQRPMKLLELPELGELLDTDSVTPYPFNKTFAEAGNEPFCYLHTSGSTGVPKPIPWSHSLIGTIDAVRLLPPVEGDGGLLPWTSGWNEGDRVYSSFPMSHGAGIIMNILMPSLFRLHCILGPRDVLPNMNLVESLADHAKIDIWSMVPSLVDELGETPDVLAKVAASKFICASGGPVSPISAGKANERIRVLNLTGTTEGLFIGNLWVPREDWLWFAFHPWSGFEFKEIEPETFEHWVHRNEHHELFQGIFKTFPAEDSINFKDLYMKHPTKPNLWAFKGRNDDLVVLSNGYKISPLDTEALITTHPAVNGCLVIGTGKPQAGLLVELIDPSARGEELLDSIWPVIEQANGALRHTNQLLREYVFFAEPDKPFIRTDKRTIKRAATLALHAEYIERMYSTIDVIPDAFTVDTSSLETITESIRAIMGSSLPAAYDASPDTDIFSLGMDSLQVAQVVNNVRAAMNLKDALAPRHLYGNPTMAKFAAFLARLAGNAKSNTLGGPITGEAAKTKWLLDQHQARTTFSLNAFDYFNPAPSTFTNPDLTRGNMLT